MIKHEIAKEITVAVINSNLLDKQQVDTKGSSKELCKEVAENLAAFYNKLLETLSIEE